MLHVYILPKITYDESIISENQIEKKCSHSKIHGIQAHEMKYFSLFSLFYALGDHDQEERECWRGREHPSCRAVQKIEERLRSGLAWGSTVVGGASAPSATVVSQHSTKVSCHTPREKEWCIMMFVD